MTTGLNKSGANTAPEDLAVISPEYREQIDRLVNAAARAHGHLCPGQVIGVRMAILGLAHLGYGCPLVLPDIKNVVGFVEIERCLADAVATASGLRLGRGSLKFVNLGLLAATFYDMPSGKGIRVVSRDDARDKAVRYAPDETNAHARQLAAYRAMPDEVLFDVSKVRLDLAPWEIPGARPPKVACDECGVAVRSAQIRHKDGRDLCAVCAGEAYFEVFEEDD